MLASLPKYSFTMCARVILWLVVVGYVAYAGLAYRGGYAAAERGERPLYTDFTHAYAASLLLRQQPAENLFRDANLLAALDDAARAAYGPSLSQAQVRAVGFAAWMYPPTFLFLILPLAFVPYLLSFALWIGATGMLYVAAVRAILRDASAWPFALAAPPFFSNLMFGQTGFLSAGLIGLGLAHLQRHPVLAGLFIGLASVKPHLGLLIPFALAAGGYWRTFAAATCTTLALIVASAFVFGMEPWYGTIGSVDYYLEGFRVGGYNFKAMTSVLSTVRSAGGSIDAMWLAQNLVTAAMILLVAAVWWHGRRRPELFGLQAATVCFAAPLATPMAFVYDLVIIVPGAAWLWADMCARGFRVREIVVLCAALVALLLVFPLAIRSGVQLGAVCIAALLGLALYRYVRVPAPAALSASGANRDMGCVARRRRR